MPYDPTWDFRDPASKTGVLAGLRGEIDKMFELAFDPARWQTPPAGEGGEARDMVGHLFAATDGYLPGFDIARARGAASAPVGVAGMAKASDEAARAFRAVPRAELPPRLQDATAQLMNEFESLSDADWSGLVVPEPYVGPLPAMFI